ncbi:hypothetical protein NVP1122B_36 [Vibrio phage 1.122.B._10N.286.46.F8]|nr:hypothetical protein NVP1122A_36 [Vibrio phage 1.122.A._10N.286.46.F8]AUR89396.1 hypothetical protein NVP1122B_36 [Vibrio phage 1.122.B._10N.286.46.F8]
MWIVRLNKKLWLDAEKIDSLFIGSDGGLKVTVTGDASSVFTVESEFESNFLNHLEAMNQNGCCEIQSQVEEVKNDR